MGKEGELTLGLINPVDNWERRARGYRLGPPIPFEGATIELSVDEDLMLVFDARLGRLPWFTRVPIPTEGFTLDDEGRRVLTLYAESALEGLRIWLNGRRVC